LDKLFPIQQGLFSSVQVPAGRAATAQNELRLLDASQDKLNKKFAVTEKKVGLTLNGKLIIILQKVGANTDYHSYAK
jgi:hypothetical protein